MIDGVVTASFEAVCALTLRGPSGETREVKAVIDTGFTGYLTLPAGLVAELGLPFVTSARAILANGRDEAFDVHSVTVLWDRRPMLVDTYVSEATPLIGMRLLDHCDLYIQVRTGGRVRIETHAQLS